MKVCGRACAGFCDGTLWFGPNRMLQARPFSE